MHKLDTVDILILYFKLEDSSWMGATDTTNYGEANRAVNEPLQSFIVPRECLLRHKGIFATQTACYDLCGKHRYFISTYHV